MWFSKRQNSVEASTFGSEFMTMKNAVNDRGLAVQVVNVLSADRWTSECVL